jgi:hypothetical protein
LQFPSPRALGWIENLECDPWEAIEAKDKSTHELLIKAELSTDAKNEAQVLGSCYTAFMPYNAVNNALDSVGVADDHTETNKRVNKMAL